MPFFFRRGSTSAGLDDSTPGLGGARRTGSRVRACASCGACVCSGGGCPRCFCFRELGGLPSFQWRGVAGGSHTQPARRAALLETLGAVASPVDLVWLARLSFQCRGGMPLRMRCRWAPRCWKLLGALPVPGIPFGHIFPGDFPKRGQFFHGRIDGRIIPDEASQGVTKGAPGFPRTPLSTCGNARFETNRHNP